MKTKRLICILTLVCMMLILCSCNLFGTGNYGIQKVDANVESGLEFDENEGIYYAEVNKEFRISIDWHKIGIVSPTIEWHVVNDGKDNVIQGEKSSVLDYLISKKSYDIYKIYAKVSGVKSNEISIKVGDARLSIPTITSSTHNLIDGIIQQKLYEKSDVTLFVGWNEDDISSEYQVDIRWFVDGVESACTDKQFTYKVDDSDEECEVYIEVEISIANEQVERNGVYLVFISGYALIDRVDIDVVDDRFEEVEDDTFYIIATRTDDVKIDLIASIEPSNSNIEALCTWTVQNSEGKQDGIVASRQYSHPLSYGKNVISASVENVESRQIIVYVLQNKFDNLDSIVKNAISQKFIWQGNSHDGYINNKYDLAAFMGYAISQHKKDVEYNMYIAIEEWRDVDVLKNACSSALQEGNDESGTFSYSISSGSTGSASINFDDRTVFGVPQQAISSTYKVEQANSYVRYEEIAENRTSLPIDSASESVVCLNSNEIYRAVSNGYKPVFENNAVGQKLQALYDKAREVLLKYVDDSMSEKQKVDIIFDWIVNEVDYDYAAAENTDGLGYKYNAFYLEGVFNDNRAVCDGKSKAFALLCGMEGIKAKRIVGVAGDGEIKGGHAWNKVLIDANDDGVREWYVVDVTWSDVRYGNNYNVTECFNYAYYLVTDKDIQHTHESTMEQPTANTVYNVFANTFIEVGGEEISLFIKTTEQRDKLVQYSKVNGNMYICVALDINASVYQGFGYLSFGDGVYVLFAK